ncbi:helix-turn-helix domain-containing protein [Psychrobacillus psychrotolerans]|uniref:helix-turn-helix domain-containing protein n=1 Tax=Psychrobacillus psychrotolerans TaxID=126156 RepID=UPI003314CC1C
MNEFGEYLKQLRGKRSLRELERITGLSHTYLSTLEKGYDPRSKKPRHPTPEVLKKISGSLDVEYDLLLEKAGYIDKVENTERLRELLIYLEEKTSLNEEYKDANKIIKSMNKNFSTIEYNRLNLTRADEKYVFSFNMPTVEKVKLENEREILKRIPEDKATETFFSIENLLFLSEHVNYNGIQLTENDKEKIINNINEMFPNNTNNKQ